MTASWVISGTRTIDSIGDIDSVRGIGSLRDSQFSVCCLFFYSNTVPNDSGLGSIGCIKPRRTVRFSDVCLTNLELNSCRTCIPGGGPNFVSHILSK